MPAVAVDHHLDPAHFRNDVLMLCELSHGLFPGREYFVATVSVGFYPDGSTQVVKDDRCVRKCAGQICQIGDVGVIDPAFKR